MVTCRRTGSYRHGPHAEPGKQPLIQPRWCLPSISKKLGVELTEAKEGQVDCPPTDERAQGRDINEPTFRKNL
jgi:hypothetical protein